MTIVQLGQAILQVKFRQSDWHFRAELHKQIQWAILDVVGRCFQAELETEVTRALGREPYQRRKQAAFGSSNGQCGRCHTRDRRKFSRNGHYIRYLETIWGRIKIRMPQVRCECGGAVQIPFQTVIPYQRFWDDVAAQIRAWYGHGMSLRQVKMELDAQLATSVGLRKLNEAVIAIAHLTPDCLQQWEEIPPVVRVDGIWIKLMEPMGETRKDRLGRTRQVKTGVSRPILVAQGVWPALKRREILAWLVEQDEGLESWQHLFEQLFRLGVRPEKGVRLLVGDGSRGLRAAWQANWWVVPFQRCIFHKLRNIRRVLVTPDNIAAGQVRDYKWRLIRQAARIWQAIEEKDARLNFQQLAAAWQESQPQALATLERDFELTLSFYPVQAQARSQGQDWPAEALRTTSPLEREFRSDRRRLRPSVLFHSRRGLLAAYAQKQMRKNARRKGIFLDQHQRYLESQLAIS
jgi:transposase-like protein